MKNTKNLSIPSITNGTVIDHIPAGQGLKIIELLQLIQDKKRISVGLNLKGKRGDKDIVKVEGRYLSDRQAHEVAVFAPEATINIIKNKKVYKKTIASMPKTLARILVCPNEMCITRYEPVESFFYIQEQNQRIYLHCKYCEQLFERDDIQEYMT